MRPLRAAAAAGPSLHLAWHLQHVPGMVAATSPYYFLLVPAETSGELALIEFEFITHTGKPAGAIYANPLQLLSPRDPELTDGGATAIQCPKEIALIQALYGRAQAASYVLPRIVPTGAIPAWARGTISSRQRQALWRVGGA